MENLVKNPKILKLNSAGLPQEWISTDEAVTYYATDMVLFELGTTVITYHGGINRLTQKQSIINANSIIAIKGGFHKNFNSRTPALTNHALFERDRYTCAYCGGLFKSEKLSRDHIKPKGQGGLDIWMNVVTACRVCNSNKGCRTVEQARMPLLYTPYVPDIYEEFILKQGAKKILADQMEYLLHNVNKQSRIHQNVI